MLAIASCSTAAYAAPVNVFTAPAHVFKAAATRVAEVSIVGFDKRRVRQQVDEATNPLRRVSKAIERASNSIVMTAEAPPRIADIVNSKKVALGSENLFPASVIGDYGWDPLGLATPETFVPYREAEIKHGRLAMLAAVAWPLQEILHPIIVDGLYSNFGITMPDLLVASNGASPSLVNGGLLQPEIVPALAAVVLMGAALEETDINQRADLSLAFNEYPNLRQAGNCGFDPLNLYKPLDFEQKRAMHEKELLNGRVAMLAIASYVATEAFSGVPVVRFSSALFEPIFLNSGFRSLLDAAFGIASMDGSIDGIAY